MLIALDREPSEPPGGQRAECRESYPEIWIRDLNTFVQLYLDSGGGRSRVRQALLVFLGFQQPDGDIPDAYEPASTAVNTSDVLRSPLEPGVVAFKNAVETDQETLGCSRPSPRTSRGPAACPS